jgi:hypothetical protein
MVRQKRSFKFLVSLNLIMMKKRFKYTFSFSMILILLVSTLQFSLYKMDCLMSGNSQISLSDFEDCNKRTTSNSVSQKCCEFAHLTLDFDYETALNSKTFKITPSAFIDESFSAITKCKFIPSNDFIFYTNLPPPSGYELLKVVQVFRI